MNILQKIFKEHYEEIEYILHPRPIVMENIEKMINCGGFSDDGFWRVVKHFSYTYLRKSFQTVLLNEPESHIGPSLRRPKQPFTEKIKMVSMSMPDPISATLTLL